MSCEPKSGGLAITLIVFELVTTAISIATLLVVQEWNETRGTAFADLVPKIRTRTTNPMRIQ